jgi:hypothetical protein
MDFSLPQSSRLDMDSYPRPDTRRLAPWSPHHRHRDLPPTISPQTVSRQLCLISIRPSMLCTVSGRMSLTLGGRLIPNGAGEHPLHPIGALR